MRTRLTILSVALMLAIGATSAAAQQRPVPASGQAAAGVSIGLLKPAEGSFTSGPLLAANIEGYLTPRVSVRGQLSGAWLDIQGRGFSGTVHPIAITGNVVYNWEGGDVHPYVTGGVGLYRFNFNEGGFASTSSQFGINAGGGAEYFVNRGMTITGEILFHAVDAPVVSHAASYQKGGYLTLAVGAKWYF